jgi:cystathionine beta-lyase
MTAPDFDTQIDRHGTNSARWDFFDDDVISLWVADMDFRSPEPVLKALHERVDHGVFGYSMVPGELAQTISARMKRLYDWDVKPEDVVFMPRVITAVGVAAKLFAEPGDGALIQTPVYGPFFSIPRDHDLTVQMADLTATAHDGRVHYEIDFDRFEAAIDDTTKLFILCNPHNPVGRMWTRAELARMAEICLEHDVLMVSDEIHCDLVLDGRKHLPLASLAPEVAARTITVMAPTKTFNIPGLGCAFAIIQNEEMRERYKGMEWHSLLSHVGIMGATAALAAYRAGGPWLDALLKYVAGNRDFALTYMDEHIPELKATRPEATYLMWLDRSALPTPELDGSDRFMSMMDPFFIKEARVALNAGKWFGESGEPYARLNLATPRQTLQTALDRMAKAVAGLRAGAAD